ncbi:MAG TPA: glycosyltransferase family 39 protein, partial [bacterium]|nr:glycosyltransferase family 39 protein [bacterium]
MGKPAYNKTGYVVFAAAATAAAAALYIAAAGVSWVGGIFGALGDAARRWVSFFYARADMAGDPGLWLKYALCFAVPAVLWAAALAKLAPRAGLRVAGLIAQKWFVYLIIILSVAGVAYAAAFFLGDRALAVDESTLLFQSKIFCRGRLAAAAPPTEGDLEHAFFRSQNEVVRFGRWFSAAAPLHPMLLCVGRAAGWPNLIPVLAAAVMLVAVYAIGRRSLGPFGGALAAVLAATSPLFIFTQASYSSGATFVCFFALAAWACWEVGEVSSKKAALALGVAAGAAFLVSAYTALYLALPFAWYLWRRARSRAGRVYRPAWFAAGFAPFVAAWMFYNWRQTGNVFLPPRFFADAPYFGFGAGYGFRDAISAAARGVVALSTEAF